MGNIEKQVDTGKGLTVYTVSGRLTAEEYSREIERFYATGPVTRNVILDLTGADLEHMQPQDVHNISRTPRPYSGDREGGRTAIVAPDDLAFGLARMYEFTNDPTEVPVEIRVFRTHAEAERWLDSE